jgi:xylulokinase
VAYALNDCLNVLDEMGVKPAQMLATGGGGRSGVWRQMLADVYDCKVVTTQSKEGPALGVAILAGVGAGLYPSVREACDSMIKTGGEQLPNKENQPAYAKCYRQYKSLYPDLKNAFKRLKQ